MPLHKFQKKYSLLDHIESSSLLTKALNSLFNVQGKLYIDNYSIDISFGLSLWRCFSENKSFAEALFTYSYIDKNIYT